MPTVSLKKSDGKWLVKDASTACFAWLGTPPGYGRWSLGGVDVSKWKEVTEVWFDCFDHAEFFYNRLKDNPPEFMTEGIIELCGVDGTYIGVKWNQDQPYFKIYTALKCAFKHICFSHGMSGLVKSALEKGYTYTEAALRANLSRLWGYSYPFSVAPTGLEQNVIDYLKHGRINWTPLEKGNSNLKYQKGILALPFKDKIKDSLNTGGSCFDNPCGSVGGYSVKGYSFGTCRDDEVFDKVLEDFYKQFNKQEE